VVFSGYFLTPFFGGPNAYFWASNAGVPKSSKMDSFKLALFQQERRRAFPPYRSLPKEEAEHLRATLAEKLELDASTFETALAAKQVFDQVSAVEERFDLLSTLARLRIRPAPDLFINWHQFERVDSLKALDLDRYFEDIWFPAADDIDLFDQQAEWIVSIRHDGAVSFVRAPFHTLYPTPAS
jgi:hypothetical protein